jgi:hypothetical protein
MGLYYGPGGHFIAITLGLCRSLLSVVRTVDESRVLLTSMEETLDLLDANKEVFQGRGVTTGIIAVSVDPQP